MYIVFTWMNCTEDTLTHALTHLEEIKQELFDENYTNAQKYVLSCHGIISSSPHNIRDVATEFC